MAPRYQQLADEYIRRIQLGELPPGVGLPSEAQLGEEWGLSRPSVRRAMEVLRTAGLVTVAKGRGAVVRAPRTKIRRNATERYRWEKTRAALDGEARSRWVLEEDAGETPSEFMAEYEEIQADPQLAADLGLTAGETVLRRTYQTIGTDGHQMVVGTSYIPLKLIESNSDLLESDNEPWPGGTIHQLSTVGIEVAQIQDAVTARPPTPAEAADLGLQPGTSVIQIRKISIDTNDRVVEIAEALFPGDCTELLYTVELPLWSDD